MNKSVFAFVLATGLFAPIGANAWFIFFPIPNLSKPAPLNALIDALEKSDETKAVAFAAEDKTFGQKMWVWGHHAGKIMQEEADRVALGRCEASLARSKAQQAGGQPLYDFGKKKCELYTFVNKTVWVKPPEPPAPVQPSTPAVVQPEISRTERKLRELDELLKSKLISEEEYAEKRKTILSEM